MTIGPGEYIVLASDPDAFESRYPGVPVVGAYLGSLANGGEEIRLLDENAVTIVSADYDDDGAWPLGPDGYGYSLVRSDLEASPDAPTSWRASRDVFGSPGSADPAPLHGGVVVHELLARASSPLEDAIELFNPSASTVDIGGLVPVERPIQRSGAAAVPDSERNHRRPGAGSSCSTLRTSDSIFPGTEEASISPQPPGPETSRVTSSAPSTGPN